MCDVRGCNDPCFVWVDGVPHCWDHFEIMWDRWQVPWDYPGRVHWDDIQYRLSDYARAALQTRIQRVGHALPDDVYFEQATTGEEGRENAKTDDLSE